MEEKLLNNDPILTITQQPNFEKHIQTPEEVIAQVNNFCAKKEFKQEQIEQLRAILN